MRGRIVWPPQAAHAAREAFNQQWRRVSDSKPLKAERPDLEGLRLLALAAVASKESVSETQLALLQVPHTAG